MGALAVVATYAGLAGIRVATTAGTAATGPTWNVAVQDRNEVLVWQTGYPSRLACFRRAAALNVRYANTAFTCVAVFADALPFH